MPIIGGSIVPVSDNEAVEDDSRRARGGYVVLAEVANHLLAEWGARVGFPSDVREDGIRYPVLEILGRLIGDTGRLDELEEARPGDEGRAGTAQQNR